MGGVHRTTTPTGLSMDQDQHMSYVTAEEEISPVPAICKHSDAGSSPDLIRSMSEPNVFEENRDSPPSWFAPSSAEGSVSVPRVVSNVMPSTETVAVSLSPKSDDPLLKTEASKQQNSSGNSKPAAARRRQNAKGKSGEGGDPAVQRRQKRLERNRESARLSRRRRKQYLEVLESKVTEFSHEMDKGRREHVAKAVTTIQEKRQQLLDSGLGDVLNKLRMLQTSLSRSSQELMVATTFRSQQLKSFALPPSTKFILWLTLQSDTYFRGGRAASERLSAARIGERILNSGTDKVTPAQSMWPLLCSEVGLSYEQEEKVRGFQRTTLQNHDTWVDRHTSFASGKAMESAHDAIQAVTLRIGQRERSTLSLLTPEQQMKFLSWANRNRERLAPMTRTVNATTFGDAKYQTSDSQHPAANLYILNHRLQSILQKIPRAAPLVTGGTLKKLSRRPSFESLGCYDKEEELLMRERSFPSTGSLKRSASEMTIDAATADEKPSIPPISPPDAQVSAAPTVEKVLGHVKDIIPPPPTVTVTIPFIELPAPTPISCMSMSQPSLNYQAPSSSSDMAPAPHHPGALLSVRSESAPVLGAAAAPAATHSRKSSFLPPHLGLVPEELWPEDGGAAEEFLMNLVDEDWAIGEGIDMELEN